MNNVNTLARPNNLFQQNPVNFNRGSSANSLSAPGSGSFQQGLSGGGMPDLANMLGLLMSLISLLRGDGGGTQPNAGGGSNTGTPSNTGGGSNTGGASNTGAGTSSNTGGASTTGTPSNTGSASNTGTPSNTGAASNTGTTPNNTASQNSGNYQQDFRSNVLNVASNNQSPFKFDEGKMDVARSNPFWEKVSETGLSTRSGVKPSDALQHAFNNPGSLTLDCTRGANMIFFKAELDTLGADAFNQRYANGLKVGTELLGSKPGFDVEARLANGSPQAGFRTIDNELTVFDPAKGDKLVQGDSYYFENPGDNSTYLQGWTAIYMGQGNNGAHQFWTHPGGTVNTRLSSDGRFIASNGPFAGDYLSSLQASPNQSRVA